MKRLLLLIATAFAMLLGSLAEAQSPDFVVRISHVTAGIPGCYGCVSIVLDSADRRMSGFNFLIEYDDTILTFEGVTPGYFQDSCAWEYFTYRLGRQEIACDSSCPSGLVRVVAMANVNNGAPLPTCLTADTFPVTLFKLSFLVSDLRIYEDADVPIRFYWFGCTDNTISYKSPWLASSDSSYISEDVHESVSGASIADPLREVGRFYGAPEHCLGDPSFRRAIAFFDGGVKVMGSDPGIDAHGDLNLDGIGCELADRELYARYFLYGDSVFTHPAAQTAASDANRDGVPLSIMDLVYMTRVIYGDIDPRQEYTPPPPVTTVLYPPTSSINIRETEPLGAVYLVVSGNAHPSLDISGFQLRYAYDVSADATHVLIYDAEPGQYIDRGVLLSGLYGHKLLRISAATIEGGPVNVHYDADIPPPIQVAQNYPNPFVTGTAVTTRINVVSPQPGSGRLEIFNLLGRKVYDVKLEFPSAGSQTISWPGTDLSGGRVAPGIYFYRVTVGEQSVTKKMLLLK